MMCLIRVPHPWCELFLTASTCAPHYRVALGSPCGRGGHTGDSLLDERFVKAGGRWHAQVRASPGNHGRPDGGRRHGDARAAAVAVGGGEARQRRAKHEPLDGEEPGQEEAAPRTPHHAVEETPRPGGAHVAEVSVRPGGPARGAGWVACGGGSRGETPPPPPPAAPRGRATRAVEGRHGARQHPVQDALDCVVEEGTGRIHAPMRSVWFLTSLVAYVAAASGDEPIQNAPVGEVLRRFKPNDIEPDQRTEEERGDESMRHELDENVVLEVRRIPVPGKPEFSMRGVFVAEGVVRAAQLIGCYHGAIVSSDEHHRKEEHYPSVGDYSFTWNTTHYMDPTDERGTVDDVQNTPFVVYVNEPPRNILPNALVGDEEVCKGRPGFPFYAYRDVHAGEELFVCYGNNYGRDYVSVCESGVFFDEYIAEQWMNVRHVLHPHEEHGHEHEEDEHTEEDGEWDPEWADEA